MKLKSYVNLIILALAIMFLSISHSVAITGNGYPSNDSGATNLSTSIIYSEDNNLCAYWSISGWIEGDNPRLVFKNWQYATETDYGWNLHNLGDSGCEYAFYYRAEKNNSLMIYNNYPAGTLLKSINFSVYEKELYTVVGNGNLTMYKNNVKVVQANQTTGTLYTGWLEGDLYTYYAIPDAGYHLVTVCDNDQCENEQSYNETIPYYSYPYYLAMDQMTATFAENEQGFFENIGYIDFSRDTYVLGENMEIFYYIPDFSGSWAYQFDIGLYDSDGGLVKLWSDIALSGSVSYSALMSDTYTAKLYYGLSDPATNLLKSTSSTVMAGQNSLITDKTQYNISENVMVSGLLYPDSTINNKGYIWLQAEGTGSYEQYSWNIVSPYTYSKIYNLNAGTYTFTLMTYSNYGICEDTIDILSCYESTGESKEIIVRPSLKANGYGNLSLDWENDEGLINSLQKLSYTNATYSDDIYIYDNLNTLFVKYRSNDYDYNIDILIPNDNDYIGTWKAKIVNSSNTLDFIWSNISIVSKSMMNYTNDYGVTIDFDQDEGNGGMHGIKWYTGSYRGNYSIRLTEPKNGLIIKEDYYYSNSTKTQTGTVYLDTLYEYYMIQFIDNNNIVLSSANIKIVDYVQRYIDDGTITSVDSTNYGTNWLSNILGFIGLPIFWGLVFICIIIYYLRNNTNLILPVIFIIINIEAVVGLLDPYSKYIVVMTWLIVAINFIFVQRKTTG